jgi:hypothetical protein
MEPREHVEHAKQAADANRHTGPRTHLEKIAALEVLVLAVALGLLSLAIQFYDNAARQAAYRVSDSYAEAVFQNQASGSPTPSVSATPTPAPSPTPIFDKFKPSPNSSSDLWSQFLSKRVVFPPLNIELLNAREARALRDDMEASVGILQVFAACLQIAVVLASAAVLNRRFSVTLLWAAPVVASLGLIRVLLFIVWA